MKLGSQPASVTRDVEVVLQASHIVAGCWSPGEALAAVAQLIENGYPEVRFAFWLRANGRGLTAVHSHRSATGPSRTSHFKLERWIRVCGEVHGCLSFEFTGNAERAPGLTLVAQSLASQLAVLAARERAWMANLALRAEVAQLRLEWQDNPDWAQAA